MNIEIQTNLGTIYVWEVEDYDLRIGAKESKRSIEKLAITKKINELNFSTSVQYKESGQPFLSGEPELFLSISHCQNQMAIYLAHTPVGVDIEQERSKLFEGRSYFVNQTEEQGTLSQEILQLIWSGKEALYKQFEGKIKDLKNEVTFLEINKETGWIEFAYDLEKLRFGFLMFEKKWLVYSI